MQTWQLQPHRNIFRVSQENLEEVQEVRVRRQEKDEIETNMLVFEYQTIETWQLQPHKNIFRVSQENLEEQRVSRRQEEDEVKTDMQNCAVWRSHILVNSATSSHRETDVVNVMMTCSGHHIHDTNNYNASRELSWIQNIHKIMLLPTHCTTQLSDLTLQYYKMCDLLKQDCRKKIFIQNIPGCSLKFSYTK